jgi:hypothetical protein
MSTRGFSLTGHRQLVLVGLALVGLAAVVAVLFAAVSPFGARVALGSGSGGGSCISTTGPVCHFTSTNAFADFDSVSSDGCIFTFASVQPFDSLTRPGNATSQAVFVTINKFDNCQGIILENASNFDPGTGQPDFTGTIQFGTKLSTATVVGTAPMFDSDSGALLFTTSINVTWQGFGATTTFIDSSHSRSPGFISNIHFSGDTRMAEASGTLTDETGANLATPATLSAQLDHAKSGTVQIVKS